MDATVLWDPDACPDALQLIAIAGGSTSDPRQFDLQEVPGLRTALRTPDGCNHLLYKSGDQFLQLLVFGAELSNPVRLLTDAFIAPEVVRARLRALEALNQLLSKGKNPRNPQFAPSTGDRLCFVLRALDGRLAAASYKEIATALFGAARVQRSWSSDNGHLKNRVRRAVRRGRTLMAGEYRRLLIYRPFRGYPEAF